MDEFIQKMSKLYRKIQNGSASDEEKNTFEFELLTSCMNRKVLMQLIEGAAREKK